MNNKEQTALTLVWKPLEVYQTCIQWARYNLQNGNTQFFCLVVHLTLVRLQVTTGSGKNQVLHGESYAGCISLSLGPRRHETVYQHGTENPCCETQQEGNLSVATSASRVEADTHTTSSNILSGHTAEGQLSRANEPGESTQVLLSWWESKSKKCETSPEPNLPPSGLLVWFHNKTLSPLGCIPFGSGLLDSILLVVSSVISAFACRKYVLRQQGEKFMRSYKHTCVGHSRLIQIGKTLPDENH